MKISVTSYKIGHYIKKLISEKKEYTISTLIVIKPPQKKTDRNFDTCLCTEKRRSKKKVWNIPKKHKGGIDI